MGLAWDWHGTGMDWDGTGKELGWDWDALGWEWTRSGMKASVPPAPSLPSRDLRAALCPPVPLPPQCHLPPCQRGLPLPPGHDGT